MTPAKIPHTGRRAQVLIYLGKFFRMFIFQNDWKVLPMAAVIAATVCFVVGPNLFVTMEGTVMGSFALSCVCIWNGLFNSIQVVCRERAIIKREHRSGLHMSSYVLAHMIYQAFLCLMQTSVTLAVCRFTNVRFPAEGFITPWILLDLGITLFLATYSADMLALMISSFVRSSTTAMTIVPFVLIFQLIFSGSFFTLSGPAERIKDFTISGWGQKCMCVQGEYNSLPMVTVWNTLVKMQNMTVEVEGQGEVKPLFDFVIYAYDNGLIDVIEAETGRQSPNPDYEKTKENVYSCWLHLAGFIVVFSGMAVLFLEFIDRDKR